MIKHASTDRDAFTMYKNMLKSVIAHTAVYC